MNSAVNFILESGVSLALLSLIYLLFLRRETFFKSNRLFLLVSLLFSVILPFLKFRIYESQPMLLPEVTVTPYFNLLEAVTVYGQDLSGTVVQTISSSQVIVLIYLTGLLFFFSRYIFRIGQIVLLIANNKTQKSGPFRFVYLNKDIIPFSFLNYVFINPAKKDNEGCDKIIAHELEHIKQGHTYDVLILEILTIFQWFNPFMWLLKRVIRENHEFLADSAVLNSGISAVKYKQLLLNQSVGMELKLANNFNSSLIYKRIKMISRIRSSRFANLKYFFGIITVLALLAAFACEKEESIEMVLDNETTEMRISFLGEKLRIEANTADLSRLKRMFFDNIKLESDSLGNLFFVNSQKTHRILDEGEKIYTLADKMPEFQGGDEALRDVIANSVKYPEYAVEKGIQGKVYVTFVVSKYGEVANCETARGIDESLDNEAVRVINDLPNWIPGTIKGEPVNVRYTVPINFKLGHRKLNDDLKPMNPKVVS
ncbi:MAG: M56 family metallopeptidase [Bacteroidota bacterium]